MWSCTTFCECFGAENGQLRFIVCLFVVVFFDFVLGGDAVRSVGRSLEICSPFSRLRAARCAGEKKKSRTSKREA